MSIRFDKSLMLSGNDYPLTPSITLHHPSIRELLELNGGLNSEDIYWRYVQTIMCDPYSNMVMLDDLGKDFTECTPFEVFMIQWKQLEEDYKSNKQQYDNLGFKPIDMINKALNFFMVDSHEFAFGIYENGDECIYDTKNNTCQINSKIFEYIYEWLKTINKVDYSNRINPADENAKRILIEDARDEIKKQKRRKKKNDDIEYIGNLMSAISFGGNGVITPFNIKDCKIWWIFEAHGIDSKKSHASHILDGLYHGTISKKDINMKELDWIK